jgi:hypothetical protein
MSPNSGSDPILIDLALQGGGSHGAFTWGVLDRYPSESCPKRIPVWAECLQLREVGHYATNESTRSAEQHVERNLGLG